MEEKELLKIIEQAARDERTVLDLSFQNITTLTTEIGNLTNLNILFLNNNKINGIPESIGNLDSLEEIYLNDNQALFKLPNIELVTRLIEGSYPDYGQIIPTSHKQKIIVNTTNLIQAVKSVSLFSQEGVFDVISQMAAEEIIGFFLFILEEGAGSETFIGLAILEFLNEEIESTTGLDLSNPDGSEMAFYSSFENLNSEDEATTNLSWKIKEMWG